MYISLVQNGGWMDGQTVPIKIYPPYFPKSGYINMIKHLLMFMYMNDPIACS